MNFLRSKLLNISHFNRSEIKSSITAAKEHFIFEIETFDKILHALLFVCVHSSCNMTAYNLEWFEVSDDLEVPLRLINPYLRLSCE